MARTFDKELLQLCNAAILCLSDDAQERLVEYAAQHRAAAADGSMAVSAPQAARSHSVEERLNAAVIKGDSAALQSDLDEALGRYAPMQIIEQILMAGMSEVGELFAAGSMFLPQVVKSARTLRAAVNILEPHIKQSGSATSGHSKTILLATVKGDVHDIGKNIVSIVLACNGFKVVDLGVMIPCEQIIDGIREHRPDLVGLSGLITPSLEEMKHVAQQMNHSGFDMPLLIGGATTTPLHTALHLDLAYPHRVFHARDASQAAVVARAVSSHEQKHEYTAAQQRRNEELRRIHAAASAQRGIVSIDIARANKLRIDWSNENIPDIPHGIEVERGIAVDELVPHIDWSMFMYAWGFRGKYPDILSDTKQGAAAAQLYNDAANMLHTLHTAKAVEIHSVAGFFMAHGSDEDIVVYDNTGNVLSKISTIRQLHTPKDGAPNLSLADFVAPVDSGAADHAGMFVLSVQPSQQMMLQYRQAGNEYDALLVETLCQRLAEACACRLSLRLPAPCLRFAVGYPSLPDHSQKRIIFDLLHATENIGATLTDSYMIVPPAAQCGLLLANPQARYF
jgi:5-methyltetrahydrofolate--homocysteine methyltransferase